MWRNAKTMRDHLGALQALGLLLLPVGSRTVRWTHRDIIHLVSEDVSIGVGDVVLVDIKGRNSRKHGCCKARYECDDGIFYDIAPPPPSFNSVNPKRAEHRREACGFMSRVPARLVQHEDALLCKPGELTAASMLIAERFAGARPDEDRRPGWTRWSVAKNEIVSQELRSRSTVTRADGGAATAKTGVVWMLKVGVTILRKRINERLKKVRRRCNKTVPSCRNHDF